MCKIYIQKIFANLISVKGLKKYSRIYEWLNINIEDRAKLDMATTSFFVINYKMFWLFYVH